MDQPAAPHPSTGVLLVVFLLLLALLALTVGIAHLELGRLAYAAAMLIAVAKAVLIVLYFMHVRYSTPLTRLAAFGGFFWLLILLGLSLADYSTRGWLPFSG